MSLSGDYFYDPEYEGDLNRDWTCVACGAGNSPLDGECQFCDCEGEGACRRDSCSDRHFPSWDVGGAGALRGRGPLIHVTGSNSSPLIPVSVLRLWAVQLGLAPPRWLGRKVRELFLWRLPDVERIKDAKRRRRA